MALKWRKGKALLESVFFPWNGIKKLKKPGKNEAMGLFVASLVTSALLNLARFFTTGGSTTITISNRVETIHTTVLTPIYGALLLFVMGYLMASALHRVGNRLAKKRGDFNEFFRGYALSLYPGLIVSFGALLAPLNSFWLLVLGIINSLTAMLMFVIIYYTAKHTYRLPKNKAIVMLIAFLISWGIIALVEMALAPYFGITVSLV